MRGNTASLSSAAPLLAGSLLAGALLAVATPALAQDHADRPFQGAKVTAIVGIDNGSIPQGGATGVVYGGQLGYDLQRGRTVFGIEGEVTGASTEVCYTRAFVVNDRFCDKVNRDLYIGGRLGRVIGTSTLLYIKAGYTNARESFYYRTATGGPANFSGDGVISGIRGGVGVERRIGPDVTIKAEYRYSDYGRRDFNRNQGVVGVGFHF